MPFQVEAVGGGAVDTVALLVVEGLDPSMG
jgi:hypothetical protein